MFANPTFVGLVVAAANAAGSVKSVVEPTGTGAEQLEAAGPWPQVPGEFGASAKFVTVTPSAAISVVQSNGPRVGQSGALQVYEICVLVKLVRLARTSNSMNQAMIFPLASVPTRKTGPTKDEEFEKTFRPSVKLKDRGKI